MKEKKPHYLFVREKTEESPKNSPMMNSHGYIYTEKHESFSASLMAKRKKTKKSKKETSSNIYYYYGRGGRQRTCKQPIEKQLQNFCFSF